MGQLGLVNQVVFKVVKYGIGIRQVVVQDMVFCQIGQFGIGIGWDDGVIGGQQYVGIIVVVVCCNVIGEV